MTVFKPFITGSLISSLLCALALGTFATSGAAAQSPSVTSHAPEALLGQTPTPTATAKKSPSPEVKSPSPEETSTPEEASPPAGKPSDTVHSPKASSPESPKPPIMAEMRDLSDGEKAIAAAYVPRLGEEITPVHCGLPRDGCYQRFQGGTIHWSPASGAHPTWGGIQNSWGEHNYERGKLGYPITNERCGLPNGGCYQRFQGGTIHWSPASGAHPTWGGIQNAWARHNWERGRLGYPVTDERCSLPNRGCYQWFQGGTIHWSPASGAHPTWGEIRDIWGNYDYERGRYGYPTSDPRISDDGRISQGFQHGTIRAGMIRAGLPYGIRPDGGKQLIVAHTGSRGDTRGVVELWELRGDARWHRVQYFSGARFGYNGLTPYKREGDGKTPMGQYRLPFGFGTWGAPRGTDIPYRHVDANDQWCSRSSSRYYNEWMESPNRSCPSHDAEVLSRYSQYRHAAVIDYNPHGKAYRGSAIFLHIHGRGSTAGCISISTNQMRTVLRWLDSDEDPRIVIAPRSELDNQ